MIRHYDGTPECARKISAQSKRGAIWTVEWTWRQHRICLTKTAADKAKINWRRWKERQGWKFIGTKAVDPETGQEHVCQVKKYDPHSRRRIL